MNVQPPDVIEKKRSILQRAFYWTIWSIALVAFTVVFRIRRFGMEKIPANGPCLIVANHQSHLDPPLVSMCVTNRQSHFVARVGLFSSKWFGGFIGALNALPIRNDTGDIGAIREVLGLLEQGHGVIMFPEGSRSPDGRMHEFKRGVGLLVKKSKCPVVPVAVEGCFDAWPRSRAIPRLFGQRVAVMVGDPIPYAELMASGADAALARLATEIDAMRFVLRAKLRAASNGRYPAAGAGDSAVNPAEWFADAATAQS